MFECHNNTLLFTADAVGGQELASQEGGHATLDCALGLAEAPNLAICRCLSPRHWKSCCLFHTQTHTQSSPLPPAAAAPARVLKLTSFCIPWPLAADVGVGDNRYTYSMGQCKFFLSSHESRKLSCVVFSQTCACAGLNLTAYWRHR